MKDIDNLPSILGEVLNEFLLSKKLDVWHEKSEEIAPSYIIDNTEKSMYEFMKDEEINDVRSYYSSTPKAVVGVIDNLIKLGISNLYGKYDSNITMDYLEQIILTLNESSIDAPNPAIVAEYNINHDNGWGKVLDKKELSRLLYK